MLLSSTEFKQRIQDELRNSQTDTLVLSAFIKSNALEWLLDCIPHRKLSIIARWQKRDLLFKASDVDCYNICKENNIRFGINLDLHGKVYAIDNKIFVGSANLTSRGLALGKTQNLEFGVGFEAGEADKLKIENFKNEVVWLDDLLFDQINDELDSHEPSKDYSDQEWTTDLYEKINTPIHGIWVHQLNQCSPISLLNGNFDDASFAHDIDLLEIHIDQINSENLQNSYRRSLGFKWLSRILRENGSVSFGGITAALHDYLIDDPKPYRKDVKEFVKIIFDWAKFMDNDFVVARPRYSEILSLKR